jgi:hypothetical protein
MTDVTYGSDLHHLWLAKTRLQDRALDAARVAGSYAGQTILHAAPACEKRRERTPPKSSRPCTAWARGSAEVAAHKISAAPTLPNCLISAEVTRDNCLPNWPTIGSLKAVRHPFTVVVIPVDDKLAVKARTK